MRVQIETDTETPLFGLLMSMVEKDVDAAMVKIPVATREEHGTINAVVVFMGTDMEQGPKVEVTDKMPTGPALAVVHS